MGWYLGAVAYLLQGGLDLIDREVEAAGDQGKVGVEVLDLFAEEDSRTRRGSCRREGGRRGRRFCRAAQDGDLADAVGLGELAVAVDPDDLEAPHAGREHHKDGDNQVLGDVELAGRDLFFAVDAAVRRRGWRRTCAA